MLHLIISLLIFSRCLKPITLTPIIGGVVIRNEDTTKYSYMVSLHEKKYKPDNRTEFHYQHFCGGSLLNPRWILSAGHCLWEKNIADTFAVIGPRNITNISSENLHALDRVEYTHFEPISLERDIVLVRLRDSFHKYNFNNNDVYGKLPSVGMKAYRENPCKIIGFGSTDPTGPAQGQLAEAEVHVITNNKCLEKVGHVWAPNKGDNKVCALGKSKDSCYGDSGGPLICKYNGDDYIYGITSYGISCGITDMPSIYTMTGPYADWIESVINN